jgi:hypothetical protein
MCMHIKNAYVTGASKGGEDGTVFARVCNWREGPDLAGEEGV